MSLLRATLKTEELFGTFISDKAMRASPEPSVGAAIWQYWRDEAKRSGVLRASLSVISHLWEFAQESTPWRLRQRYGDADYDWDHRVNTTSAALGWRERLIGGFSSPYQPTEPALFQEMLAALQQSTGCDLRELTFVDLGSGKGRTLLMASEYPFRRIVGVELLPGLARIAQENLRAYESETRQCFAIESVCRDATEFPLPDGPLLIYLFNPFPEAGLRRFLDKLRERVAERGQRIYVLYHNPLLEGVVTESGILQKVGGTHQYSIFASVGTE